MQRDWVISLRDQCRHVKVPFFFKQWGGVQKSKFGRTLNGRTEGRHAEASEKRCCCRAIHSPYVISPGIYAGVAGCERPISQPGSAGYQMPPLGFRTIAK